MSRSISSRAFSLRSRASSAATAPSPLGAIPASDENLAIQPRRLLGSIPRLLAASGMLYPWALTRLTAEILNSRVYFRLAIHCSFAADYPPFAAPVIRGAVQSFFILHSAF